MQIQIQLAEVWAVSGLQECHLPRVCQLCDNGEFADKSIHCSCVLIKCFVRSNCICLISSLCFPQNIFPNKTIKFRISYWNYPTNNNFNDERRRTFAKLLKCCTCWETEPSVASQTCLFLTYEHVGEASDRTPQGSQLISGVHIWPQLFTDLKCYPLPLDYEIIGRS